jgi:hypothetical protein
LYAFIANPFDKILEFTGTRVIARVENIGDFIDFGSIIVYFNRSRSKFDLITI